MSVNKSKKIMLDAGHYKGYNQSKVFKKYYEGDMTFKLQGYLKEELEEYGFIVNTTRKHIEKDLDLYTRGYMSKGHDMFLSLHSNAVDDEKVDRVVIIKGYDQKDSIAKKLAVAVQEVMKPNQAYQIYSKKYNEGEYYGVLRGAKAGHVDNRFIIEHSFHSNKKMAQWLYEDANLKKLAVAEAKAIADIYNYKKKEKYTIGIYKVITDTLNIRAGAGTNFDVVGEVKKGDAYTIIKVSDNWGYLKSEAGWINISSKYCQKIK